MLQMKLCNTSPRAIRSLPIMYWENKMHSVVGLRLLTYQPKALDAWKLYRFCDSPQEDSLVEGA